MIGFKLMLATEVIERRFEFAALPRGWWAIAAIVLLATVLGLVIALYHREQRAGASTAVRSVLAGLRVAVFLLLAGIALEPILATYIHRSIESRTLVLVDESASMSLRDRYADETEARRVGRVVQEGTSTSRNGIAEAVLRGGPTPLLDQLARRNPVRVYRFAEDIERVALAETAHAGGTDSQGQQPTSLPAGRATNIGRAVRDAVEDESDRPVAAIVVLSDGRFNQGEPTEIVARYAWARKIPIHCVGIGDPAPARNITVTGIDAPANVFVKDPFEVTVRLSAAGLAGERLAVELLQVDDDSKAARPLETKAVTVEPTGRVPSVAFDHRLTRAASVRLIARVRPRDDEILTDDNQRDRLVRALDDRMRVLVVAGGPTWEYRYVSRLLERDATIDLSCWLQSADETAVRDGNTVIDRFPATREELARYDCIVLIDPDPRPFDGVWAGAVESLVADAGCGLLYVAGRKYTSAFLRDAETQELVRLLPVEADPGEAELILNELGHFQTQAWPVALPRSVAGHPVLALADQPVENGQIWSRLPGVYWHYPVRRAKPVATVLLRHSHPRMRDRDGGHVLLATQFLGAGHVGFMGFQGTWRWRRFGEAYFDAFWIQLLRHLVEGKLLSGQKRGFLQAEPEVGAVGEPLTLRARLQDAQYLPLERREVTLTVQRDGMDTRVIALEAEPDRPGWYRGRFVPTQTGTLGFRIDLPGGASAEPATVRAEVRVAAPDLEYQATPLDRTSLRNLATGSAGGRYWHVDETDELARQIGNETVSMVLSGPATTLWDRPWMWGVLSFLLAGEWALRKWACLL